MSSWTAYYEADRAWREAKRAYVTANRALADAIDATEAEVAMRLVSLTEQRMAALAAIEVAHQEAEKTWLDMLRIASSIDPTTKKRQTTWEQTPQHDYYQER